ncbi:MAG: hypothetical protein IID39_03340, partial [Planctomycetes bacterium]|nr:hypothetical protein [Planctomycetota bacterium]
VSQLRFKTENGWSEPQQMSMNLPAHNGGYWYFQSTWDPPAEGYAGMNYTGLGVGNRNGVHIQLAGTIIAVSGMIFAFYFKPIVRRRMQQAERRAQDLESTAVATAESVGEEREVVQPIGLG